MPYELVAFSFAKRHSRYRKKTLRSANSDSSEFAEHLVLVQLLKVAEGNVSSNADTDLEECSIFSPSAPFREKLRRKQI